MPCGTFTAKSRNSSFRNPYFLQEGYTMDMNENVKNTPEETVPASEKLVKSTHEGLEIFMTAICMVMLLFTLFCRVVTVDGNSMRETLHHHDKIFVSGLFYTPTKGDVVILRTDSFGDEALVKRVIATEGDIVDIDFDTWTVYVNGEALDEPYVNFEEGARMTGEGTDVVYPYTVGEGEMFVMGDNRNHSTDSRYFGTVDTRNCLGKVYFRLFPFSGFGKVE